MTLFAALRRRLEVVLDAALSQAEDPHERVRLLVAELRARQAAGRRAVALTIILEKQLVDELVAVEDEAATIEAAAKEALARGDEKEAEACASRLVEARRREEAARARWQEQRALADKVREAFEGASRRIDEVARSHTLLLARARASEAMQAIAQALETLASPAVKTALERAALKVERREPA